MSSQNIEHFDIDSPEVVSGLASGILSYCRKQTAEFLKCKATSKKPEDCLRQAIECRKCAFTLAKEYLNPAYGCDGKFTKFVACVRDNKEDTFHKCYQQRLEFETCAAERIGIEFRDPVNPKI